MSEEPKEEEEQQQRRLAEKRKKKDERKDQKKRKLDSVTTTRTTNKNNDESTDGVTEPDGATENKKERKTISSLKQKSAQKRSERLALLERVPKVDPDTGIAFTKLQLRRMTKRVAKGLHPIESPAEIQARLARDAQLRRDEQAELAGIVDGNENEDDDIDVDVDVSQQDASQTAENDASDDDDEENDNDSDEDADHDQNKKDKAKNSTTKSVTENNPFAYEKAPKSATETLAERPLAKKKRRDKPVPADYVCSACHNNINEDDDDTPFVRHWIYDCPRKTTTPGINQVSRKQRGLNNPADYKVFVSGLPFDATVKDVTALFTAHNNKSNIHGVDNSSSNNNNKKSMSKNSVSGDGDDDVPALSSPSSVVVHCKLIKFEDTGRCKGQAFVTFATAEAARQALRLSGQILQSSGDSVGEKKKNSAKTKSPAKEQRKDLKLKVTKVLNRFVTKSNKK